VPPAASCIFGDLGGEFRFPFPTPERDGRNPDFLTDLFISKFVFRKQLGGFQPLLCPGKIRHFRLNFIK
jgi:hypothetical protein